MSITTHISELRSMNIIGIPCVGLNNMGEKVGKAVNELMELCKDIKSWNGQPWFGIFQPCPQEVENEKLIYYVCIEIDSISTHEGFSERLQYVEIPNQKYLVVHKGKDDSIRDVYGNLTSLLNANGLTQRKDKDSYIIEISEDEMWESVNVYIPIE